MNNAIFKSVSRIFSMILVFTILICSILVATSVNGATISSASTISTYVCDFEDNYYSSLSSANCTSGKIVSKDGNKYLRFQINSSKTDHRFEIYNSSNGVFKIKNGNTYAVTIKYKVESIGVSDKENSSAYINLVRYNGSDNQLVKIKTFPNAVYQPGSNTDWVTSTVVFKSNVAETDQYNRLAINIIATSSSTAKNGVTSILFDDITISECLSTTNTISFDSNGGSYCDAIMAQAGETITLPTPTKKCYDFKGWFKNAQFTQPFNDTTMPASATTNLYAKWDISASTIKINFDTKRGSAVEMCIGDAGDPLSLPIPVRDGFRFAGWYNSNYTQMFTSNVFPNSDTTLYAKWEVIPRLCNFDNREDFVSPDNQKFTQRASISQKDKLSGNASLYYNYTTGNLVWPEGLASVMLVDDNGDYITLKTDRTHRVSFKYKVESVNTGKDKTCSFGLAVSNNTSAYIERCVQDQIENVKYSSADIGKGWLTCDFTFQPKALNETATYLVLGIGGASAVYIDDIFVYEYDAEFGFKGHMVAFESNGGSYCETIFGNAGDAVKMPANPVREGYEFLGWFTDKECKTPYNGTNIDKGYTLLYASWNEIPKADEPIGDAPDTDTDVDNNINTDTNKSDETDNDSNTTLLIIIIAIAVLVVGAAVIVIIMVLKKKSKKALIVEETTEEAESLEEPKENE